MSGKPPTSVLFPRMFVPRRGVVSSLTCRHPKHVRCACHGQPAAAPAPASSPGPATATAPPSRPQPRAAAQPNDATAFWRQQESEADQLLTKIMFVIRDFPDANAAVSALLKPNATYD